MPTQTSLSTISPEAIAHGTEIQITVGGITVGEIYEMQYDEDNKIEAVGTLGTRIIGRRRGQYEGKFTLKAYWLNAALRSLVDGGPVAVSMGSNVYGSTEPFLRFDIVVSSTNPSAPNAVLKNCVVEKDAVAWTHDKVSTDDVSGFFEDRYGK